jgi:hypothetical protein
MPPSSAHMVSLSNVQELAQQAPTGGGGGGVSVQRVPYIEKGCSEHW